MITSQPLSVLILSCEAMAFYALTTVFILQFAEERRAPLALFAAAGIIYLTFGSIFVRDVDTFWRFSALFAGEVAIYIFAFGAIAKSLSLRIFYWIGRQPRREASLEEIVTAVMSKAYLERITILEKKHLVEKRNSSYELTSQGKILTNRIAKIKSIFRIETGGLYSD